MKIPRDALIANRRLRVEKLVVRGLTQREIEQVFIQQKIVNPETGKPWALGTINADVQALEAKWDSAALESKRRRKAKMNQELQELKKAAWADRDLKLVRETLKDEAALFNLADPIEVNMNFGGQVDVVHSLDQQAQEVEGMTEEELDLLIQNLLTGMSFENRQIIEGEFVPNDLDLSLDLMGDDDG